MTTVGEFYKIQNECLTLLQSIKITTEHASNLISFVDFRQEDENEVITEMQPMYKEHFDNLQKSVSFLSSYADRLGNKLNQFKDVIDKAESK